MYNPHVPQALLSPEQFMLTIFVKLAVMAVLATMLARYHRFRHILIFERRGWVDRLVFTLALGVPLAAGVAFRVQLNYYAADLTLEGALLAGLIAGPYTGALVGVMVSLPAVLLTAAATGNMVNAEFIALPFAVGCGFAGGGLREICPKEAIWHFSPLFFTDLHRYVWRLVRRLQIDWVVVLLAAPIGLEILRQALGHRFSGRIFSAYSVRAWKPDPALFLHAGNALGVPPAQCAVIEDSELGIAAGIAAGMQVFAFLPEGGQSAHREARTLRALSELSRYF